MTTAQKKIGSGFGARTTAREVLAGIDLAGKNAIVTGGYSGLGLETTRALAEAGAHVIVPARRPDAAREALAGIANVEVDTLDLGDLESVRAFAERFLASMACPIRIYRGVTRSTLSFRTGVTGAAICSPAERPRTSRSSTSRRDSS